MKYLKCTSAIFFLLGSLSVGQAQALRVFDADTNTPLESVAIFSEDRKRSTLTGPEGNASLSIFLPNELVTVQYFGYETQQLTVDFSKTTTDLFLVLEAQNLDEVILSVARSQSKRNEIAEKVAVISSETIRKNPMSTGADLLALTPGVRIQKSQGGGGSPVLRGFEANRVLLVVDGVRMNNAIYRSGHLQNAITLDPNTIERVEVMFGSSSVGYGSDALGGVIHYYTKSPVLNRSKKWQTRVSSEFNSATQSGLYHASADISKEKWGSLTSFSFSQFGDIRMGANRTHGYKDWGLSNYYSENTSHYFKEEQTLNPQPNIQRNTGYSQYDFLQKFLIQLRGNHQLLFNLQYSTSSNINRFDKLNENKEGMLRFSEWYYGPQKRLLASSQYKFFPEKKWLQKGTLTAAYQNVMESRNKRKFGSLTRSSQEETVQVLSLNGDFSAQLTPKHQVNYGFEGVYNNVYSRGYSQLLNVSGNDINSLGIPLAIASRYPSDGSDTQTYAIYGNWIWKYAPKWTFNLGYRLTHYQLSARWKETALIDGLLDSVSLSQEALTWTLAAVHRPSKQWQWNVLLSNGFKAPNIDDIGKIRENSGVLVVPNAFLRPEYAYNFDLGFTVFSKDKRSQLSLRNYITLISRHIVRSNYIVFSDVTTPDQNTVRYDGEELPTVTNKNLGDRWVYGSALDTKFKLNSSLELIGNLTFTGADHNTNYGPMPSISPLFGSFALSYSKARFQIRSQLQFSTSKDPSNFSLGGEDGLEETPLINPYATLLTAQYAGTPAWSDLSILTNYQWSEKVNLKAGLENLFDIHYRTFASGVSAPGRSFRLGLQVQL